MIIALCITSISAVIRENTLLTTASVLKHYAEEELAKVILLKHRADKSQNSRRKEKLTTKAQESVDELQEIEDYLEDMLEYLKHYKKSYNSYHDFYVKTLSTAKLQVNSLLQQAQDTMDNKNNIALAQP